jgi:hypothetical protein
MTKKTTIRKESLAHKIMLTALSATIMAIVGGLIGYKLNTRLPELYYEVTPQVKQVWLKNIGKVYETDITISNLGIAAANELTIRYAFDHKIMNCDYNYSEKLNGKLPSANIEGGTGNFELLLTLPRLVPKDKLEAKFYFANPYINYQVKVFSKEGMGQPYVKWLEKIEKSKKIGKDIVIISKNIFTKIEKNIQNTKELKNTTSQ